MCICECGNAAIARTDHLRSELTQSCGCLKRERTLAAKSTHSKSQTREYKIWNAMRTRCTNPRQATYALYGGRGIKVCERWAKRGCFENFIADMGPAPSNTHSLDRIDSDGDYTPENCRWATPAEQANNTRSTLHLTHDGRSLTITAWAKELGVPKGTLHQRLHRGWSVERTLTP